VSAPARYRVLASGIAAIVVTLGVARFAYTPMLAPMRVQTGLSEDLAGWLAGWNYLGYLVGAIVVSRLSDLEVKDRLYRAGLVLAVVTTAMMAVEDAPIVWGISRFLAGLTAAAGLLVGSGLVLNWLIRNGHRGELGLHFSGAGLGIVIGALVVDLSGRYMNWQGQWLALTAAGALFAWPALAWLPRPRTGRPLAPGTAERIAPPRRAWVWLLQGAYCCAGFGFVVSATFTVVITELEPALEGKGIAMWVLVGLAAAPAAILWDRVARRIGFLDALKLAYGLQIVGIAAPALSGSLWAAILGALLFGVTFIGIVSLVLTMVGILYPAHPAKIMAQLTLGFGIAQIVGPVLAGEMAAATGSFDGALYLAAAIMAVGLACLQGMTVVVGRTRVRGA